MHVSVSNKFILGVAVIVAAVAFSPYLVGKLNYSAEITALLGYAVGMTTGWVLGWLFARSFIRRIGHLTSSAEVISHGDLTQDVTIPAGSFPDELDELSSAINKMGASLRQLVRHVRETSGRVSDSARTLSCTTKEMNSTSEEIAQAIEHISHGAETQATMVSTCSTTIHDLAVAVNMVATSASDAAAAALATSTAAQQGMGLANESLDRIRLFFDSHEQAGHQFVSLNAKLQQAGKIVDFIGEIARQTNMLALNASIEAVRAGEFGKGFAVVAEEVRKLADGTAKSVGEISELITIIREESRMLQIGFSQSSSHIGEEKKNIDTTINAFRTILQTVRETERKANNIAELAQLQTTSADAIVRSIDEIARVTDDYAASTEQVSAATTEQSSAMQGIAAASQELAELATQLLQLVERFRIESLEPPVNAPDA